MIEYRELLLLLRDGSQLDAIESLVADGLSAFVVKDGQVIGMHNTAQGNARLASMTLPRASE